MYSDGFTTGSSYSFLNGSTPFVAWNWNANTTPSKTYVVTVVSDSGNKYRFDGFGTSAVTLDLQEGGTYKFDQSHSSNSGHPFRFGTSANGSDYTTGVTTSGTPGNSGAYTQITVAAGAATLYYACSAHSGMGGQANTNSTSGSSNFSGSIQSNLSANVDAGFSIVSYTGNATSGATIGHGLSVTPEMIIVKERGNADSWAVYHTSMGNTKLMHLDQTLAERTHTTYWNDTSPTSSVFSVGSDNKTNGNNAAGMIAYCFHSVDGYSKVGSYTGNDSSDGTFVYTSFAPSLVILKYTSGTAGGTKNWHMYDNKRSTYNPTENVLFANENTAESGASAFDIDFLSNGFKLRNAEGAVNNAAEYVYIAFAETPFKYSNAR